MSTQAVSPLAQAIGMVRRAKANHELFSGRTIQAAIAKGEHGFARSCRQGNRDTINVFLNHIRDRIGQPYVAPHARRSVLEAGEVAVYA